MCGISLIVDNADHALNRRRIQQMNTCLSHRGPDADGVFTHAGIAMGHTRLSIVDIAQGAQPMRSADGRLVIIFNGEIYNYRVLRAQLERAGLSLKTQSDTEVLLGMYRLYGEQCLGMLRGMFAFALYDLRTGAVFLARDRLGIKPLFYSLSGERLVAASEMKALFASGLVQAELDAASIYNYFQYQFSVQPHTPFCGVKELPPAHYLRFTPGSEPELKRYWDLDFPREGEYESAHESYWLKRFEQGLGDAASSHAIGEVPIASYLSGGIDSCAMTWLLKQTHEPRPHTFSIHFEDPQFDESDSFRHVAQALGAVPHEVGLGFNGPDDAVGLLERCIYHLEQPQRMAVDLPHYLLAQTTAAQGFKVVYTGDGADEILAGYDCFRQDSMRSASNGLLSSLLRRRKYLKKYTEYFSQDHMRLLLTLHGRKAQGRTQQRFGCYPAWFDFWQINNELMESLCHPDRQCASARESQMDALIADMHPAIEGRHSVNQSLYLETRTRLPGWILWKSDRLSMASGVEARVPFMDHELVELAARMPPDLKLRGMDEKYALKKVMQGKLPTLSHGFKKRGFYTPIRDWFFTPQRRDELQSYLSVQALRDSGLFNEPAVSALYQDLLVAPVPTDMDGSYRLMRKEWALMTVLTVQMMQRLFVSTRWSGAEITRPTALA